ncbi:MAG: hypothetical protein K8J09_04345, partial [Planctomycetes bacterium]|nr:hypothetical protein [Planctomycetota bacterium]
GVTIAGAAPLSFAFMASSSAPNNINLFPCRLLLDLPVLIAGSVLTDAVGSGTYPLAVPNDPLLVGANLCFQWIVLVPVGPLLGAFDASNGLQIGIGG